MIATRSGNDPGSPFPIDDLWCGLGISMERGSRISSYGRKTGKAISIFSVTPTCALAECAVLRRQLKIGSRELHPEWRSLAFVRG